MSTYLLEVPSTRKSDKWTEFINNGRFSAQEKIPTNLIVDLCGVGFFKPAHIVSLACLIEEYSDQGVQIQFRKCDQANSTMAYLENIKFFHYWRKDFDRTKYHRTANTALCLWKLNHEMIHPYVINAQGYFQHHFFSRKDLQPLNTSLAELFNNIIDHSQSKISGYTFSQYYPQKKEIAIAVCDFGRGIPNTVNTFLEKQGEKKLSDTEALTKAFQLGFSTKSTPTNRGFGLDTIKTIIKTLESYLLVISNNACIEQQNDGKFVKYKAKNDFPGTLVYLRLNTRNLGTLDEDEIREDEFSL